MFVAKKNSKEQYFKLSLNHFLVKKIDSPFTKIESNLFEYRVTRINFMAIALKKYFVIISFARTKDFIEEWME